MPQGSWGGTLAARVNVLVLMVFNKLWILDKSRIKCGMSQVEWKAWPCIKIRGPYRFFDGGVWLALFRAWLLFSASGFIGGTLAARVNVLIFAWLF